MCSEGVQIFWRIHEIVSNLRQSVAVSPPPVSGSQSCVYSEEHSSKSGAGCACYAFFDPHIRTKLQNKWLHRAGVATRARRGQPRASRTRFCHFCFCVCVCVRFLLFQHLVVYQLESGSMSVETSLSSHAFRSQCPPYTPVMCADPYGCDGSSNLARSLPQFMAAKHFIDAWGNTQQ